MSDVMPIEQAEFIDTLQRWFNESTNMCHEDCYNLAFIIWQHKDYLSKMLGYEKGRADELSKIVNMILLGCEESSCNECDYRLYSQDVCQQAYTIGVIENYLAEWLKEEK